jgi:hypothetical protein
MRGSLAAPSKCFHLTGKPSPRDAMCLKTEDAHRDINRLRNLLDLLANSKLSIQSKTI